ncbi:hypothetical protein LguiA_032130 [Lonicera macranthoides]
MEALNLSAGLLNPRTDRPNFSYNGNVFYTREVGILPCSCISHFGMFGKVFLPSRKECKLVFAWSSGRGTSMIFSGDHSSNSKSLMPVPFGKTPRSSSSKPCQVKSEDSEGILSGESIILNEQTLEHELQIAIEEENYSQAAKIRDSLKLLQEDNKASVLAANARFYNSFRNGDLAAMQALWSKDENVCVVHPGVSGISGYDLVMGSWEFVWADYEFPLEIEVKDVQVHVRGDVGYVTCVEMVKTKGSNWGRQFATNVFEKIEGQWFICIHHASYVDL